MVILMTIAEKLIEARVVLPKNLQIAGYMEGLKKDMIEQNEDIINLYKEEPEFKFEDSPGKLFIN